MTSGVSVLHVGTKPDLGPGANGIAVATWPLLAAQVTEGAQVTLLVLGEAGRKAYAEAERIGVTLLSASSRSLELLSRDGAEVARHIRPDVVHFHSVFMPAHAQLAVEFRRRSVPYFVSPHGGLNLWRGRLKKAVYGALVEKPYFRDSEGIFVLTLREQQLIERWLRPLTRMPAFLQLPNVIPALSPGVTVWTLPARPRLVYLGRFDVVKKGLDRLVQIARHLPDVQVFAYGVACRSESYRFRRLCRHGLPANMRFIDAVYGDAKFRAFTEATIYVQTSRDEGFGMSIVEAMRLGVPVALTQGCDIVQYLAGYDNYLPLPDDPGQAAARLRSALQDMRQLQHLSRAGREWTIDVLSPTAGARLAIQAYETILSRSR